MIIPVQVQIIGAPIACKDGIKDSWCEVAQWAAGQLHQRFGESVKVQYFDLFDPACPVLPPMAQLPLVLINGVVMSSGLIISIPAIRKYLEGFGIPALSSQDRIDG